MSYIVENLHFPICFWDFPWVFYAFLGNQKNIENLHRPSGHQRKGHPRQVVHEARGLARNGSPQDLRQDVLQKRNEHDDLADVVDEQ